MVQVRYLVITPSHHAAFPLRRRSGAGHLLWLGLGLGIGLGLGLGLDGVVQVVLPLPKVDA